VAAIVGEIAALVERDRRFDPAVETRELSLACADNQELSDGPRTSTSAWPATPASATAPARRCAPNWAWSGGSR
jgi:hypothetical protein